MVLNENDQETVDRSATQQPRMFEETHLRDYLWVIRKRLTLVIVSVVIAMLIGVVYLWRKVPVYSATTQILVGMNQTAGPLNTEQYSQLTSKEDISTYSQILMGPSLARKVIDRLGAQSLQELGFQEKHVGMLERVKGWVRRKIHTSDDAAGIGNPKRPTELAAVLREFIEVQAVKNSRLLNITYTCERPEVAAKIANEFANAFIDDEVERRLESVGRILRTLKREQREFRKNVKDAEQQLLNFQDNQDAVVIGLDEKAKVQDALAKTIETLTSALATTRVERVRREATQKELIARINNKERVIRIPVIANHPLVSELVKTQLDLSTQLSELLIKYGEKHPRVTTMRNSLAYVQKQIDEGVKSVVENIQNLYKTSLAEEKSLSAELLKARQEMRKANKGIIEYNMMVRDAETNKELFDVILMKAKETSLAENVQTINIHVINPAQLGLTTVRTKIGQTLILSLFLGLAVGCGLAFFVDYMDNSISDPRDVESYLQCNLLGIIENIGSNSKAQKLPFPIMNHPKGMPAEHFRTLRTNLLFSPKVGESRQMVITSTLPEEGKTTIAVNLAVAMAQSGRRVLIVDSDMRRPYIHKVFDTDREYGLSSVLTGDKTLDEVVKTTAIPGLSAVSAGPIPPNQTELLGADAFVKFAEEAKSKFDIVIYDTPPLTVVDPIIIARRSGAVALVVIRSGETPRNHVKRALMEFTQFEIPFAGVLLNKTDISKRGYYYNYYYYGYYRYGYQYQYGQSKDSKSKNSESKDSKTKDSKVKEKPSES